MLTFKFRKYRDADGTLDGISSLTIDNTPSTPNDSSESANVSDDKLDSGNITHELQTDDPFNDTIDRMEFMMKKGQELLASGKVEMPKRLPSPPTKTPPVKGAALNILKPRNTNSPSSAGKLFKKPNAMLITPGVLKKPPICQVSGSKIPRPKALSVPRKQKFNHIVSPVGMYISKMAPSPMSITNRQHRDFFDTTISCEAAKSLNFSVASNSSMIVSDFAKIPKKAYISASKRYVSGQDVEDTHFCCSYLISN